MRTHGWARPYLSCISAGIPPHTLQVTAVGDVPQFCLPHPSWQRDPWLPLRPRPSCYYWLSPGVPQLSSGHLLPQDVRAPNWGEAGEERLRCPVSMRKSNPVGPEPVFAPGVQGRGGAVWVLDPGSERPLRRRAGLGSPTNVETPWWTGPRGSCQGVCCTHLPWSGVRCSMEDTFSRVLWSRSWASTLSSSTMERFMCQAKLPGRSISSTGIRQMPCGMPRVGV